MIQDLVGNGAKLRFAPIERGKMRLSKGTGIGFSSELRKGG